MPPATSSLLALGRLGGFYLWQASAPNQRPGSKRAPATHAAWRRRAGTRDGGRELCQPQKDSSLTGQPSFGMPPAMWGMDSVALKHCSKGLGLTSHQLQGAHGCAEEPRGQSPKCSLSSSCQALSEGQDSTWDPRHPQPSPIFGGKRRPVPIRPAVRGEADRRGYIPGEASGHAMAENSPLEGEATHICLCTAMRCPLTASAPWGRGGGCELGPRVPMGRVCLPSADHGAGTRPRGPGQASWGQEQGAELGDQLQEYPSPRRALAGPSPGMIWAGRFPAGFCIRPLVPVAAPALRCPLPACRDSPCFSKPAPRHHVREEAAESAFFRYGRNKTAQTGDFPRQLGLNFKPLLLSLSRATLCSQGREQRPGSHPPQPVPVP